MFGLTLAAVLASASVPFQLIDNRIFVQVRVNGTGPWAFIVDTGSGGSVIALPAARRLHLQMKRAGYVTGAGSGRAATFSTDIARMTVGTMEFHHVASAVIDLSEIQKNIGFTRLDGVIGYDCLRKLYAQVDMDRNVLTLSKAAPSAPPYAHSVRFSIDNTLIRVPVTIDGVAGDVMLDTGDRSSLTLFKPFAAQNNFYGVTPAVRNVLTGFGIGGPVFSDVFRTRISLFGSAITEVLTRASRDRGGVFANSPEAGSVGTGLLKRFNIIYGYPENTLTVWPSRYYTMVDRYDPAGMWLSENGGDTIVTAVTHGGPAEQAGIRSADRVVSADADTTHRTALQLRAWLASLPDGTHVSILTRGRSGSLVGHDVVLHDATVAPATVTPDLPRHAIFGASLVNKPGGVFVNRVIPQSPAANGGLLGGDAIKSIAGVSVPDVASFLSEIHRLHANDDVTVNVVRNNSQQSLRVRLAAAPNEDDPQVTTAYGAIDVDNTLRRTLLTVPRKATSRRPAVLFIGGIGCYSIDVATNAEDPYLRLAHDLSRSGFITMRVEKSGVGDSQGPPCRDVDFLTESKSYEVALDALKHDTRVDPHRVYLFGHSMGSIIAPRLALSREVAGIVVAEAVGRDWPEYELRNTRRQLELGGSSPADVDANLIQKASCMQRLLIEKQPEAEIERLMPECKVPNGVYPVTAAYVQQVAPLNIIQAWAQIDRPTLVIYGASDFVTEDLDHRRIAGVVNAAHAGKATLKMIEGMDHALGRAASPKISYDNVQNAKPEPYDDDLSRAILAWLCSQGPCSN